MDGPIREFPMNKHKILEYVRETAAFDFGGPENSPSDYWIDKAQEFLKTKFPEDFLWFLREFGGGEINGDEVYSIYEENFDEVVGGDIVYQNAICTGNFEKGIIVFLENDFGEQYFFKKNGNGEIFVMTGEEERSYCNSFSDFLYKYSN